MDFDDVFEEFEDPHSKQKDFLAFFSKIISDLPIKFIIEADDEVIGQGVEFTAEIDLSDLLLETKKNELSLVWESYNSQEVGGVYIPELGGTLFWVIPSEYEKELWATAIYSAIKYALGKLEQQKTITENEQLERQLDVLKKQHVALVEDNHRQYLLIQKKEKEYANKLENKIAERTSELRKTNEELIEASRLKSEFLANMSHELRTPMNAIIGFSELLAETNLDSQQADYAKTIKESGAGLLNLINDILDFSKIEANKLDIEKHQFKIFDVISNVKSMFEQPAKEKGLKFICQLDESLPAEFEGDANRIKQVLVNLAGNSMKFTECGEVAIKVDCLSRKDGCSDVKFSICDTGIGIAEDRQVAIFKDFVQEDGSTTRKYGGTGLGLSISNKIVGLMGGKISLESELGRGSVFSFVLNLEETDVVEEKGTDSDQPVVQELEKKLTESPEGSLPKPVVLVVEDNLVNQKLASVLIKRQGCEVVVAGDGLLALEELKKTRFDLILMDLQMPNMGGLECTKRIREIEETDEREQYIGLHNPDDPVNIVGLSAHAKKEDMEESLAAGMNEFLTKPIVREKLEAVLPPVVREK